MAKSKKSGSWKKERASVNIKGKARPKSNKRSPTSDQGSAAGSTSRYWRAGYTRSDGTKVKGHYVNKP